MNLGKKIMGFLLGPFLFTIIILGLYYSVYFVLEWRGKLLGNILFLLAFYRGGLMTIWVLGLSYKKLWDLDTFKIKPIRATVAIILVFLISTELLNVLSVNNQLYEHSIDHNRKGFEGNLHVKDSLLGYVQVKNAKAFITSPYHEKIPVNIDDNGFRVASNITTDAERTKPLILFLGCSNTFGNYCYAEETFSYIVSDSLKFDYLNAGVCGYGLSHMYLLAQKLIPKYKPDFVVAQYSDWLAQRSIDGYAPTYLIDIPNPYFSMEAGQVKINPPFYITDSWKMTRWAFDDSKSRLSNYIDFSLNIGLPEIIRSHILYAYTQIFKRHKVLKDRQKIESFAYNSIYELTKINGGQLIVLNIGTAKDGKITHESHEILDNSDVWFAEADSILLEIADYDFEKYSKIFHHWGVEGEDSVRFDSHPNHYSHSLIAKSILETFKKTGNQDFVVEN